MFQYDGGWALDLHMLEDVLWNDREVIDRQVPVDDDLHEVVGECVGGIEVLVGNDAHDEVVE